MFMVSLHVLFKFRLLIKNVNQLRKSNKPDPNANEEPEVTTGTRARRRKGKNKAAAAATPVKTPPRRVRQKQASK